MFDGKLSQLTNSIRLLVVEFESINIPFLNCMEYGNNTFMIECFTGIHLSDKLYYFNRNALGER